MRVDHSFFAPWLALATTSAAIGLHRATKGLLQASPCFAGNDISLFPGLNPNHDSYDLSHLLPNLDKELYYSQEGHRPALHGAKHAQLKVKFVRPTVVLEHSDHIRSVQCGYKNITVCFQNPQAFEAVEDSWATLHELNLVTYHVGCGNEAHGKRSFFHASNLIVDVKSMCVTGSTSSLHETEAFDSGDLKWGTYTSPKERRRGQQEAKGHVRVVRPPSYENITNGTEDLTSDPYALRRFFDNRPFNTSHMHDQIDAMEFISTNGTVSNSTWSKRDLVRRDLSKRDADKVFRGLWNGFVRFIDDIGEYFSGTRDFVKAVGKLIVHVALITAKLIMLPFGFPFDHTYNEDYHIDRYLEGTASNKPPKIFNFGNGFTLAKEGVDASIQCAKCGIHADFNLYGRLAFSLKDGITDGTVSFHNNDPFTVDALFGITVTGKALSKTWSEPIKSFPVPGASISIPDIFTLGAEVTFSAALTVEVEGNAQMLVGGSFRMDPGHAQVSLIAEKNSGIVGLGSKFTPVARARGAISVTADVGLPIALEAGIDVLAGKWKKTVAIVDTPSVYLKGTFSTGQGSSCNNGIELRLGVKNRIHAAAIDLWDYELRDDILYEKGLTCLSSQGFNESQAQADKGFIKDLVSQWGGDVSHNKTQLVAAVNNKTEAPDGAGFRIIMDKKEDSILVSGTDGNIYLISRREQYDLSAPWGTVNITANVLSMDVFGRVLAARCSGADPPGFGPSTNPVAGLGVFEPEKVPKTYFAAALVQLEGNANSKPYGVSFLSYRDLGKPYPKTGRRAGFLYYPTVCRTRKGTKKGLRLFGTQDLFNKDGTAVDQNGKDLTKNYEKPFGEYNINPSKCYSIQLTSEFEGTIGGN